MLRGGAIGDFVMTLPALELLRRRWPAAFIELVGYPHITPLARAGGLVDRVASLDDADVARFFSLRPSIPEPRAAYVRSFDLIITYLYDPDQTVKRNMLAIGARQVIYGSPIVKEGHAAGHLMKPLEDLAIYPDAEPTPRLDLGREYRARGARRAAELGDRVIALHPGSGSPKKNWHAERFAALAERLAAYGGLTPIVLTGEADAGVARELARLAPAVPHVNGLALVEVAALLSACAAYVGNDSGITHLAASLGIPVVALFGPTDPALWGARGARVRTICSTGSAAEALASISVDTVCAAALDAVR